MVVPLRIGGGSRLKILEAFAAGLPVISTRIGAEGLDVEDGVHLTVVEDIEAMASEITASLKSSTPGLARAEKGRRLVEDLYDWEILAVDVIEHLGNPDHLLSYMKLHARPGSFLVISTPDRDRHYGPGTAGPPKNPHHVREWNFQELESYLKSQGLEILDHQILENRSRSTLRKLALRVLGRYDSMFICQAVVCRLVFND